MALPFRVMTAKEKLCERVEALSDLSGTPPRPCGYLISALTR